MPEGSLRQIRAGLSARLEARLPEIERGALTRVFAIADSDGADLSYLEGLRDAVSVALEYGLEAIVRGEERVPPPPPALLAQARMAARSGVGLDTVLRRYFAGYILLGEFIVAEMERLPRGAAPAQLHRELHWERAAVFDRLLATISEEYRRERDRHPASGEERRAERVRMLLAGEQLDTAELRYEFDAWHLAAIAAGPGAVEALRALARELGRELLAVCPDGETAWAWLGGRAPLPSGEALRRAERDLPPFVSLALGEPGQGLEGWRLSHRQADAAMLVAARGENTRVRYAEVSLLAAALRDELLATSLRRIYLAPLDGERDGGETLRATLAAYFRAGHNAASAAAALGVSRKTVSIRLRSVEERVGRPLSRCSRELHTAVELQRLQDMPAGRRPSRE